MATGFNANYTSIGSTWINNTSYKNGARSFSMASRSYDANGKATTNITVLMGQDAHVLKNNIAYPNELSQIGICSAGENLEDIVECPAGENNSWNLEINLTDDDFVSLEDPSMTVTGQDLSKLPGMLGPRNADGSLPDVDFLKLKANSQMIDKGEDVGLPFVGSAPDLGAFEYGMPKSSSSFVESSSSSGINLLVTNFGGLLEKFGLADVFDLQGRYLGTLQAEQLRDNVEIAIQRKFKKSGVYLLRYGRNIQRVNIK